MKVSVQPNPKLQFRSEMICPVSDTPCSKSNCKCVCEMLPGQEACIQEVRGNLAARMASMGIRKGSFVKLLRTTARGQSLYLSVGKLRFALRPSEAADILVV